MEPEAGIGPATYALRVRCSTTELPGRDVDDAIAVTESVALKTFQNLSLLEDLKAKNAKSRMFLDIDGS